MTRLGPADRLLVRVPSWLGDLVLAEPTLRALAEACPGRLAGLSLAGPARLLALLDGSLPGARRIPHAGRGGEDPAAWRGHDVALLLTGSFRSAWTAWRAGIPRRVGQARDGRGWLLSAGPAPARERGRVPLGLGRAGRGRRWLPRPFGAVAAELAGLLGVAVHDPRPRLAVAPGAAARVEERLAAGGIGPQEPLVVINAGGRPGSAKAWAPRGWARVADRLAEERGERLVLVGGPGEEGALLAVQRELSRARPLVLVDPVADLPELVALCARAALVLTADSGPRHVAHAVGARIVCLLGPTDPRHTADGLEHTLLVREQVPCGPCHRERCPLAGAAERACLESIDPERVVAAALALLGRSGGRSGADVVSHPG